MNLRIPVLAKSKAFTLVELIATIAIIALLVAVMVPFIGNYVAEAKKTADRQTLAVLNDALTRYKTQGGSLAALTVGADIQNVLTELRTPISWAGMQHQVLKEGDTYASEDISVSGNGSSYKFTRYGTYIDGTSYASNIVSDVGGVGDPAAFETWMANAMAETGSTNYLALTNPDTTDRFGIYARVANSGDKVRIWWGDGTTQDFDSISTSSDTVIAKVFGSSAARTIVIVGDLGYIYSNNNEGLGGTGATYFGGNVSTMPSLNHLHVGGSNTLSGDISNLVGLTYLSVGGNNTLSGEVTNLLALTHLDVGGSNSIAGSIEALTGLDHIGMGGVNRITGNVEGLSSIEYFYAGGSNTLSGDVSGLNALVLLGVWGDNTLTGSVAGKSLYYLGLHGNSSVDISSILSVTASSGTMSFFSLNESYPLTQSNVDTILGNFWANRDVSKVRDTRVIDMDAANHAAPSAAGYTTKTNLEAYMSPNNTGPMVWDVRTN